jgi:hypothetical protein
MPSPPDRHPVRDRTPLRLENSRPAFPIAPLNVQCHSSFVRESFDIRWSDPRIICENTQFNALGVNVYRSFDSEFGPYVRLTPIPIGTTFFRDRTDVRVVLQEDVSNSFIARGSPDVSGRYIFRVSNRPIFVEQFPGIIDCENLSVFVSINGSQASVHSIDPANGTIELVKDPTFDVVNHKKVPAILPEDGDAVLVSYKYKTNIVRSDLNARIFYRLTTVAVDSVTGELVETPLDKAAQTNNQEVEKLDWIWREAVRRNSWILDQGGERVKVFIRKLNGVKCGCVSDYYNQAKTDCVVCFGTQYVGGFEGPYDATIAPDDGDKRINQTNRGRTQVHSYDTWTGPSPLLSQRDFLVKLNGDRYTLGPVRMPSNRGMQLQQFFNIASLDETDIRYLVPVIDPFEIPYPQTIHVIPGQGQANPMMTERDVIPDDREVRGNTVTYENHHRNG